jgi:hypothetical protein
MGTSHYTYGKARVRCIDCHRRTERRYVTAGSLEATDDRVGFGHCRCGGLFVRLQTKQERADARAAADLARFEDETTKKSDPKAAARERRPDEARY